MAQATTPAPPIYMQGIAVPQSSVNAKLFDALSSENLITEKATSFAGIGASDVFELKKADIISEIIVTMYGSITVTPGTGTVASTARWPHDFLKDVNFVANGQTGLIHCSGGKLKVREFQRDPALSDRGVSQTVNGVVVNQGTLSMDSEAWGVGSNTSAIAAGTYNYELSWVVPVAEDVRTLAGAIFAQTSSTDLTLTLTYAQLADIFTLTGNATVTVTGTTKVEARRHSIPLGPDGQIVIPDLSVFHSLLQSRNSSLVNGDNEVRLVGQGAGKTLLRLTHQVWNNNVPMKPSRANFSSLGFRYGSNETPQLLDGDAWRKRNERMYDGDYGAQFGFFTFDFDPPNGNGFRDSIDLGTTSEFRSVISIPTGVALTNPVVETVQETIFVAGSSS